MADELKKINDYTAASAIENTTSFIAQTVSGTTQRVPLSVIKSNITNEFIKNAELVYDNYPIGGNNIAISYSEGDLLVVLTNAEYETDTITFYYGHKSVVVSTMIGHGDGDEVVTFSIKNRTTSSYEDKTLTFSVNNLVASAGLRIYQVYKIKLGA